MTITDSIGPIIVGDLGEEQLAFWRVTGPRDTACRVGDNRCATDNEVTLKERCECDENRGWIASGIRHEVRIRDEMSIQLRESVWDTVAPVARAEVSR